MASPDRGFASVSSLVKQRPGLMDLMDRWITLTLTNQTPVSALAAGLLGSREAMKILWGMGGWLRRKGVPKNRKRNVWWERKQREEGMGGFNLHHFTLWPLAAIKDTREVLMR